MRHRLRTQWRPTRGVTIFAVILAISVLALLTHNLFQLSLADYSQAAQVRDTMALQQLTDSALAQALYHLNRNQRQAAAAPIRESFGVALIELAGAAESPALRIAAYAPGTERPRSTARALFQLQRDAKGRWGVASVTNEPFRGEGK